MKKKISFSFDSFVTFRLRPFINRLEKYVELSIDEYKMEQEYQMFIQTLRDFISSRSAQKNSLHLLIDEEVMFFNEHFSEIKRIELTKMIDRKLLFNHPVYVDSTTIAPLLSIAPQFIFYILKIRTNHLFERSKTFLRKGSSSKVFHGFKRGNSFIFRK